MIQDWLEPFRRIRRKYLRDRLGGSVPEEQAGESFPCGVASVKGHAGESGETPVSLDDAVLFHSRDIELKPGDTVERLRDGARWQVTGGREEAPGCSGLDAARTLARRVVTPG